MSNCNIPKGTVESTVEFAGINDVTNVSLLESAIFPAAPIAMLGLNSPAIAKLKQRMRSKGNEYIYFM
jgi:hypothetical protein